MTTTKSFSSSRFGAFFRQALKAQLPFAIISGILMVIVYLIVFFASISDTASIVGYQDYASGLSGPAGFFRDYFHSGVYLDVTQAAVVSAFLAVLALASALFGLSYMHSKKTVDLYHAMPVTRPHLLLANLLASFCAIVVPWLGVYAATVLVQLIGFGHYGWISPAYFAFIAFDIVSIAVYIAVVLVFVAFIAVNVGTVFDTLAITMAVGFSPPVVYMISGAVWTRELYGAVFEPGGGVLCLSPFLYYFRSFTWLDDSGVYSTFNYPQSIVLTLCGIGVVAVFAVAAVVCYNRRRSEIAEQTQPSGVFQMIVKFVAAFLGAAALYGVFNNTPLPAKLVGMMFGAVLISTIAELILSRGVKNLKRSFKWLVIAGACYCVILLVVHLDWFGYVRSVPDPASVASVTVNYDGRFSGTHSAFYPGDGEKAVLTNPESIAVVTNAHRLAVENRPPSGNRNYYDYSIGSGYNYSYEYLTLDYKLKNGARVRRTYGEIYRPAYAELVSLEDKDDFVTSRCPLFLPEQSLPLPMSELVSDVYAQGPLVTDYRTDGVRLDLDAAGRQRLLDALRADLLAETLGEITNPATPALGFLQLEIIPVDRIHMDNDMPAAQAEYYSGKYGARTMTLVITREFSNTLALLPADAFTRNSPVISRAAVGSVSGYTANARVQVFGAGGSGYYSEDYGDESGLVWTDDPAEIEKLRAAAQPRLVFGENAENEYVLIRFVLRDNYTVILPVRMADLSAGLRSGYEAARPAEGTAVNTMDFSDPPEPPEPILPLAAEAA